MIYVLDAHTLMWLVNDDPQLSDAAAAAMGDPTATLVVPTIALAEISHNARKPTLPSLVRVRSFIAGTTNTVIRPFDVAVLDRLPMNLEMHDGIIVATALVYRDGGAEPVRLLSNDKRITDSGLVDVLW